MQDAEELVRFYDEGYTQAPADASRYAGWRALGAVGKADHVLALCARAGLRAGGHPIKKMSENSPDRPQRASAPPSASFRTVSNTLEVGCGDGALLCELSRRDFGGRLAGVEIARAAVEIARTRAEIDSVELYDGLHLSAADGAYELGIVSHVLEHVPDPPALLAEVARACRAVVIEVPLEANLSARRAAKREHADEVGHLQRLSLRDARAIVAHAGLRIAGELEDPLPLAVHRFLGPDTSSARAKATAKWAVRAGLHRLAPPVARRLYTVHYACLCLPEA